MKDGCDRLWEFCSAARRVMIAYALIGFAASYAFAQPAPLALHPQNPHYFLWQGKPTILVTSGEHYGALLNLDFDYERYFDELKSHGLNLTRVFSGVYREPAGAFGITDNTLAPRSARFVSPWERSEQSGAADGGNKFDLTRWSAAYFERLHDLVAQAAKRGIVVELTLFCPMYKEAMWTLSPMYAGNNVNGIGECPRNEVYSLQRRDLLELQETLVRKLVDELRGYDNLYYEVCNEPYTRDVPMQWQRRIVDVICAAEAEYGNKHLISLNAANGSSKIEEVHPAVSILNFHYCKPPDAVALNYELGRAIGENETGFRGSADVIYRTEAWEFILAGGALFNNLDYSFTTKHPDGSFLEYESPGGGSPSLRRQLGILKSFMDSLDFLAMRPDESVVVDTSAKVNCRVLAARGEQYAIYFCVPVPWKPQDPQRLEQTETATTIVLKLVPGRYAAEWLNTKTGRIDLRQDFEASDSPVKLQSPPFAADIALKIVRRPA